LRDFFVVNNNETRQLRGKWKSRRVEWNLYSLGNTKIHAKM